MDEDPSVAHATIHSSVTQTAVHLLGCERCPVSAHDLSVNNEGHRQPCGFTDAALLGQFLIQEMTSPGLGHVTRAPPTSQHGEDPVPWQSCKTLADAVALAEKAVLAAAAKHAAALAALKAAEAAIEAKKKPE